LQFKSIRELIEAAQAVEACIGKGQQGHQGIGKRRDGDYFSGRPPFLKKGKSGVFEQYKKRGSSMVPPYQHSGKRMMVGQSHLRANSSTRTGDRKGVDYPSCVKCGQKHPGDCSVSQGDALCVGEKVICGGTASILGKGVIIVVEEVIIRRTALAGTLDKYRAIGKL
jgi:hypothetical protein